jgi:hypothetical protein
MKNAGMGTRKPQVSFQLPEPLKYVYEEIQTSFGLSGPRLALAGLFYLLQHPDHRQLALDELRALEANITTPEMAAEFVHSLAEGYVHQTILDEAARQTGARPVAARGKGNARRK